MTNCTKKIIIISGKARSGKDTVADMLTSLYEKDGKRVLVAHYADMLKYTAERFFGWDRVKDEPGRSLLQSLGEDIRLTWDKEYWVDYLWLMLTRSVSLWDVAIIPDARHENEVRNDWNEAIFDRKRKACSMSDNPHPKCVAYSVKVDRGADYDNGLTEAQKRDSSETEVDDIQTDYIIENTQGITELRMEVLALYEDIENGGKKKLNDYYMGDVVEAALHNSSDPRAYIIVHANNESGAYTAIPAVITDSKNTWEMPMVPLNRNLIVAKVGSVYDQMEDMFSEAKFMID